MYVMHNKNYKLSTAVSSSTEDSCPGSTSDTFETKFKNSATEHGFIPRAGGLIKDLVDTLSLAKSQSICTLTEKQVSLSNYRSDVSRALSKIMSRRGPQLSSESDAEIEPKAKHNSLVSIMVSTIMCLASNCPIPKSNIQATKLFLSTIVNENGESPRNIKGLLTLLKNYDGPYEGEPFKEDKDHRPPSMPEAVINTRNFVLEPAVTPRQDNISRIRSSRTRSRLPSLSPVKTSIEQKKHLWNC